MWTKRNIVRTTSAAKVALIIIILLTAIIWVGSAQAADPIKATVVSVFGNEIQHLIIVELPDGAIHSFLLEKRGPQILERGYPVTIRWEEFYMMKILVRKPVLTYRLNGKETKP